MDVQQSPLFTDGTSPRLRLASPANPPSPAPTTIPTNSQIEAAIQKAQSMSSSRTSDGRSSSLGRDTRTQLFVGNLPYRVRWQDLKDLFRKAGTVLRADVSLGPDNRSRGYGTVLYGNPDDAQRAIELFNGYSWQSRILEVRPDRLPPDFDAPLGPNGYPVAVPSPLHAMPYMPPPPPPPGTLPLGGGGGGDDVQPIPSPMGMYFAGLQQNRSQLPSTSGRTLFVGNLPFHCQWQDLKDLFRQAGSVLRADVVLGPDGRSKGHGTVSFSNDADADNALRMFNGHEFNGRVLKVHYDKFMGQNTPMMSGSPAPPPHAAFIYSALPAYLAPQPHPMSLGQMSPYEHMVNSAPHSPFESTFSHQQLQRQTPPPQQQQQQQHHPVPGQALGLPLGQSLTSPAKLGVEPSSASSTSPRSPRNLHIDIGRSASASMSTVLDKDGKAAHHAHPGPITLPPPGHVFPTAPLSPQSTAAIPPITPSMPSFSFAPQAQPTPPLHAHFLSPGIGPFSPTLSPGAFFGGPLGGHPTPGGTASGPLNPAPGAPVRYTPVMVAHPHSPVSTVPPPLGSPGFYVPAYYATGPMPGSPGAMPAPEGYFPPVHMHMPPHPPPRQSHPLAQEHTPPTSDHYTPSAAAAAPGRYGDYFTPLPPPPAGERSKDASPASVLSEGGSALVEYSSPGTSLTPSEVGVGAKRSEGSSSTNTPQQQGTQANNMRMTLPSSEGIARSNSAGNQSAAAGSRATFAQIIAEQRMRDGVDQQQQQPTRPSYGTNGHAHSAGSATEMGMSSTGSHSGQIEEDMATLELADAVPLNSGPRDRRASWHVESPSIEGPRGAGVSYFALGLPAGR